MSEIQIIGPYFSNSGISRVNRGLAMALNKIQQEYAVSVYCPADKMDHSPTASELEANPILKKLVSTATQNPKIVIYNNLPKGLSGEHGLKDLPGEIKIMYIKWEESAYPSDWVDEINDNVHGVMAASSFVREVLRSSGVKVPITVVWNALDEQMKLPPQTTLMSEANSAAHVYPLETSKNFKFLHISTAKKSKGIDVLLKAYYEEFTNTDDVVLVIKSYPGVDNMVDEVLAGLKEITDESGVLRTNFPEIIHINNPNLTDSQIANLIQQSDCGVYPSRAEGFGLPILESMFNERAVIATNYSGYLDFIDQDSGWLIDYKLEYANDSEFANVGAKWAEPDVQSLRKLMREQYEMKIKSENLEARNKKIQLAKEHADNITWELSAQKTVDFVKQLEVIYNLKQKNAAVISWMNDETGIADYTNDLYSIIEKSFQNFYYIANLDLADRVKADQPNVLRLWNSGEKDFAQLKSWLENNKLDIVHIQYHSGAMFSPEALDNLIQLLVDFNIEVFVTLHAVRGESFDFTKECKNLSQAKKVFIHNKKDLEYAQSVLQNAELFIHPVLSVHKFNKPTSRQKLGIAERFPVITTHGLMNKNKGIENIVQAVKILKEKHQDILFLAMSAISSNNIFAQGIFEGLQNQIRELGLEENVRIITDFLDDEVIHLILQASDINIFAYSDAGESASGAVRKGITSMNPTIVTDITQFAEFEEEVLKIPSNDPKFIAIAVENLLQNDEEVSKMKDKARDFVQKNNYETKSRELLQKY